MSSAEKEFMRLKSFNEKADKSLHLEVFPGVHEFSRSNAGIDRSLQMFYDEPEKWLRLQRADMAIDSSWAKPAAEYMNLYESAIKG